MKGGGFQIFVTLVCALGSSQIALSEVAVSSFSLQEGDFSCGAEGTLICSGNATTSAAGNLKLTPDPPGRRENYTFYTHTVGVALYKQPIQLLNLTSNRPASLSFNFSFQIEPGYGSPSGDVWGDGMAFVMFAKADWIGSDGSSLGAYSSNGSAGVKTLAVEFDTHLNENIDFDNNHVGIDTTNIQSNQAEILPFKLVEARRVYSWVDYDSAKANLEVRVSDGAQRPEQEIISFQKNLTELFQDQEVWVGFSGSNGDCSCFNYYTVFDLSFSSSHSSSLVSSTLPEDDTKSKNSKSSTSLIIIILGITGVLVAAAALLLICARRKQKLRRQLSASSAAKCRSIKLEVEKLELYDSLSASMKKARFSYQQLCAATNNFSEEMKLGSGGFGSVYRGSVPAGGDGKMQMIAVKKVSSESTQGEREFLAEVSTIGELRHQNIVRLLGWCSEEEGSYSLVYEFMPNGSLDKHLHQRSGSSRKTDKHHKIPEIQSALPWKVRFRIVKGLADALLYIHQGWQQRVIHRDVKSSNVMLDDNFNAMLGDFGLARVVDHSKTLGTTGVAGTYGYIAPEASMTGKFTVKSDVFAFGAVCLEISCGRRVYDVSYPPDARLLVDYVWRKLSEDHLHEAMDRALDGVRDWKQVEKVLHLGLLCSHPKPAERPTMQTVVEILAGRMDMPEVPKSKPAGDYYSYYTSIL
ncbi:hypothetical protein R1flu_005286 [Riccia fluitans]|uniref:non-specific serine/threonine protein kinase n=1 Tax=Riccia fluitans TaxID=41844 RepID=A0ABD1YVQ4_9MARC